MRVGWKKIKDPRHFSVVRCGSGSSKNTLGQWNQKGPTFQHARSLVCIACGFTVEQLYRAVVVDGIKERKGKYM